VRYTGKPVVMPRDLHVRKTGVEITFTDKLDPATVADLQNWSVERWNYQWTEKYGSPEFRLSDPAAKGHDTVDVTGAELAKDGKTVRLTLASTVPAMQQRIRFALKSTTGQPVESEILQTIHRVPQK
jgi:phosphatidylserine/phosphatidylglycerophosphate/cardiolipin synthase-like enzyme